MGLVSSLKWREEVPGEPGAWIEFQPLPGPAWQEAKDARSKKAMAMSAGVTMSDSQITAIREAIQTGARQDPKDEFDAETLLRASIVSWSYYEGVVDVTQLETTTWDWALGIVHDRNGLSEPEIDRKNGSKRPTVPIQA